MPRQHIASGVKTWRKDAIPYKIPSGLHPIVYMWEQFDFDCRRPYDKHRKQTQKYTKVYKTFKNPMRQRNKIKKSTKTQRLTWHTCTQHGHHWVAAIQPWVRKVHLALWHTVSKLLRPVSNKMSYIVILIPGAARGGPEARPAVAIVN